MDEFLRQSNGAKRQGNDLLDVPFFRKCEFAATSAQIDEQHFGRRRPHIRDHAQVDESPFFQAADNFQVPAGNCLYPFCKEAGTVAVTQGAGAQDTRALYGITLYRTVEAAQDFECLRHGLRVKIAVTKNAFTQASDFTILVQRDKTSATQFRDTEAD